MLRVLEGLQKCRVDRIVVATDHDIIREVVQKAGGGDHDDPERPCQRRGPGGLGGRAGRVPEASVVLNMYMVDDPFVGPDMIDPLVAKLQEESDLPLALLAKKIENPREVEDPNIVKMVRFRCPDAGPLFQPFPHPPIPETPRGLSGISISAPYAYRRDFLLRFASWEPHPPGAYRKPGDASDTRKRGIPSGVVPVERDTLEIDTPEDVERCEAYLSGKKRLIVNNHWHF